MLDRIVSPVMFWVALLWTALAGAGIHLLQDNIPTPRPESTVFEQKPLSVRSASDLGDQLSHAILQEGRNAMEWELNHPGRFDELVLWCELGMLILFPLFALEGLLHWKTGGRNLRQNILSALCPPLRLGSRDHLDGQTLWLPFLGWVVASDDLEADLERKLGLPMILVALMVLPVIAVEYLMSEQVARSYSLGLVTQLSGGFIWLAFVVEFLVMISIVTHRLDFVKTHWLDLAIICLPLIAFLRVLRVGRLGRLLRLNQLAKVSRTAKAFRLKGLALRVWRAILLFEVFERMAHRDREKQLLKLREVLLEKERDLAALQKTIERLERDLSSTEDNSDELPTSMAG